MKVKCIYENCAYEGNCLVETIPYSLENQDACEQLEDIISGEKVKLEMKIKGRAEENEILLTAGNCGGSVLDSIDRDSCYVVPFPGTGTAGDHCDLYYPDFLNNVDGDGDNNTSVSGFGIGDEPPDQLDFSCNWNKLMFGGSQMDRVSIPLYYDDGLNGIINPFATGDATKFYLRMRTPCLPCIYEGDEVSGINRLCERDKNKTVCDAADERYVLDDEGGDRGGDIVVQWQLTGQCGGGECGLVPIPEYNANSAIFEGHINEATRGVILKKETRGYRTDVHENEDISFSNRLKGTPEIPAMATPTLTLFLNSALISNNEKNIPYLEYQILTDKPIGNPKTKMEVIASVNGNAFWKILYKEEAKGLIDFAVQN